MVVDSPDAANVLATHIMLPQTSWESWARSEVPLVVHNHGLYWAEYEWEAWAHKANIGCVEALRQADAITSPSEWVSQSIRRNTARPVTTIGHGVDLEDWEPTTSEGYVLWNKTRTDAVCDPTSLVALARMAPHAQFVTTYGEQADNVTIVGRQPFAEAREVVRRAGVYLCTARETFGIGTIEAMAAGVPVLGWRWGGQADIVEHLKDGYLVRPGDYDDLLAGLNYCLEHRVRLGKAARAKVEKQYQWKDVIPKYAEVYRRALSEARGHSTRTTIVVPAYNLQDTLPRTLDSIVAQTDQDWECIVVDDASPDDCGKIADEYAKNDPRFRVIHNKENQYLAGALNTGFRAASGKYVMPLDADNEIMPETIQILANALDEDRRLSIAYGNVEFVEPDGRRWHSGWPMQFRGSWQTGGGGRNLIPSTAMMRRRVHAHTGGYRTRWRTAEDADFWTRAASYGFRPKMVTEADTLVYYNRDDSMSRVEEKRDWMQWYPWRADTIPPPAAIVRDDLQQHAVVLSYDPPLISVIIPVGPGHEQLYIDAVDSVDAQTFRFFECIIINDSGKPLPYVPQWATLIETKGGIGVAAARNLGIAASSAPAFVPLDADDMLEQNALDVMFQIRQTEGGYVYCDWYEMWESEGRVKTWVSREYKAMDLIEIGCIHAVTALYPKKAWEEVGGFDEALPAWEDWDFMLKLANIGTCGTRAPLPLFIYRKERGMRREANYADFEGSKKGIYDKWKDFFEQRSELMGCSSCRGGGGGQVSSSQFQQQAQAATTSPAPENAEGYAIVEYVGTKEGVMTFTGPSGQTYQFCSLQSERQKYVRLDDAEWFAAKSAFRVRQPEKSLASSPS